MAAAKRVYLDWNASAPLRPEARDAVREALELCGNPSSPHREGRRARDLLEASREQVAAFLGCEPAEVVFTSGGTEANNLALRSLAAAARARSFAAPRVEHASVLRPLAALERAGWRGDWLPVDETGVVAVAGRSGAWGFGAVQAANHETGALQPLAEVAARFAAAGVPWHCDAVQAWGRVPLAVAAAGCATASLSGHKLGAPKGIGALYVRAGTAVTPLLRGGPQERERRAGTENVPGAAGLAAACAALANDWEADARWTAGLRDTLQAALRERFPLVLPNGPAAAEGRLPNTVHVSVPGVEGETLVQALDLEGVAVSAGSACASGAAEPSPVLAAMGFPPWRVQGALRVSLGHSTEPEDVESFLAAFTRVIGRLRPDWGDGKDGAP